MILIVDGNNMAHRAKHSFSLSHNGVDVSVTYGFLRILLSMLNMFEVESVIVCWDGGIPEFRRKAVPEYKANRHKDDDPLVYEDFVRQLQDLSDYVIPMLGMVSVILEGAEADDLMYHASRLCRGESYIVSSDKDMLQAINEYVKVYSPFKETLYDADKVWDEYGVTLNNYIDWKAIQGDSSDNIPGIPGIGEKTATKLFKEYGTLTGITNAAMDRNPEATMTGNMQNRINSFGFDRIAKNIYVMALYADRVGARSAVLDAVYGWKPFDKTRVKKYFMSQAFVSLLDGAIYSRLGKLERPAIDIAGVRIPLVWRHDRVAA